MVYDIITVGSATMDVFLKSKSKRVEIEHFHRHEDVCFPIGAKILIDELHTDTGGSGANAATAYSRLGFKTAFIGKLGEDLNCKSVDMKLAKEKVDFLGKRAPGSTGYSIVLAGLQNNRTILAFKGNNSKLTVKDVPWSKLKSKWYHICTMLGTSWKTTCKIASHAKKTKAKVVFNPSLYLADKGYDYLKPVLKACSVLVLNKEEAQALTGRAARTKTLLKELQKHIPLVVVTDGAKGAHAYNGIRKYSITPRKSCCIESTGAGDSFTSGFIAGLMRKQDIPTSLRWGTANALNVIGKYGATNNLLRKKEINKKAKHAGKVYEE